MKMSSTPVKKLLHKLSVCATYLAMFILCLFGLTFSARSNSEPTNYVIAYGKEITIAYSEQRSADEILAAYGFDSESYQYDITVHEDYTAIEIHDALHITVICDGETSTFTASGGTVGSCLDALGITVSEDDIITHNFDEQLYDGMGIRIYRVKYEYSIHESPIPYPTEYVDTPELEKGATKVVSEGVDGVMSETYEDKYIDGELCASSLVETSVKTEPISKVIACGTKEPPKPAAGSSSGSGRSSSQNSAPSGSSSSNHSTSTSGGSVTTLSGETYSYSKRLSMTATAYTYSSGNNITSSGSPTKYGIVAALPSTIPQGTRVYITSADGSWDYGVAVVGDVPDRDIIDLFFETSNECINFGVRNALVYILD